VKSLVGRDWIVEFSLKNLLEVVKLVGLQIGTVSGGRTLYYNTFLSAFNALRWLSCLEIAARLGIVETPCPDPYASILRSVRQQQLSPLYDRVERYSGLSIAFISRQLDGYGPVSDATSIERAAFSQFMDLNHFLERDDDIKNLFGQLDPYTMPDGRQAGTEIGQLMTNFEESLVEMSDDARQSSRVSQLRGLLKFVDFIIDFDSLLQEINEYPDLQLDFWQYHCYYFSHLRDQTSYMIRSLMENLASLYELPVDDLALPSFKKRQERVENACHRLFTEFVLPAPDFTDTAPRGGLSCFISYSAADRVFVEKLYDDLQNRGVRCWLDTHDLRPGGSPSEIIASVIPNSDKILVVLSADSMGSRWVEREMEAALDVERTLNVNRLLPIRIDDTVLESDNKLVSALSRSRHIGDFSHWQDERFYQAALQRLLRSFK
jgi:hypothetical protein